MLGKKNKKGWIKILEAFMAILFLAVILTAIVIQMDSKEDVIYERISKIEKEILQEIQFNETLRVATIGSSVVPVDSLNGEFPVLINDTFREKVPHTWKCEMKICSGVGECVFSETPESREIYADSIIIGASKEDYSPKKLKIFCWLK